MNLDIYFSWLVWILWRDLGKLNNHKSADQHRQELGIKRDTSFSHFQTSHVPAGDVVVETPLYDATCSALWELPIEANKNETPDLVSGDYVVSWRYSGCCVCKFNVFPCFSTLKNWMCSLKSHNYHEVCRDAECNWRGLGSLHWLLWRDLLRNPGTCLAHHLCAVWLEPLPNCRYTGGSAAKHQGVRYHFWSKWSRQAGWQVLAQGWTFAWQLRLLTATTHSAASSRNISRSIAPCLLTTQQQGVRFQFGWQGNGLWSSISSSVILREPAQVTALTIYICSSSTACAPPIDYKWDRKSWQVKRRHIGVIWKVHLEFEKYPNDHPQITNRAYSHIKHFEKLLLCQGEVWNCQILSRVVQAQLCSSHMYNRYNSAMAFWHWTHSVKCVCFFFSFLIWRLSHVLIPERER